VIQVILTFKKINPMITDSLTATTTAGDTVRLHATTINNTSRLEAKLFGSEDSQVVDFTSRQVTDDALKEQEARDETKEENYDSEEETKAYQAIWNAEEYIDEEPKAFTATLLPETTIPEETNIERRKIIPQQPFKKRSEIHIGGKTKNNSENAPLPVAHPTNEEEALFAKRMRDKDRARELHQIHGHMHYQKIIDSMAKCILDPEYARIPKTVLHELKNLRCDACDFTRKCTFATDS